MCYYLFTSTISITKTCSHITFLNSCQRKGIIPNGLRVNCRLFNSDASVQRINEKICFRASRQLLATQLRSRRRFRIELKKRISNLKIGLRFLCSSAPTMASLIIATIRSLNNRIYMFLRTVKERKLTELVLPKKNHIEHDRQRVYTIPEDLPLSTSEVSVLSKGLTFVPSTAEPDTFKMQQEAECFFRSLPLRAHFGTQGDPVQNKDIFQKINPSDSTFTPVTGRFKSLDLYINTCRKQLRTLKLHSHHRNLSPLEAEALRKLRGRKDLIIKPADKGGAVVVWRRDLYVEEGIRQLNDKKFYTPLLADPTSEYQNVVSATVLDLVKRKDLPTAGKRLIVDHPRSSVFYMLPKIHKPENPGRPIVSTCSCPTEHISSFVDFVLQPLVQTLPSYIKDTNHVLQKLSTISFSSSTQWLVTFDVTSLYTVIPHDEGLQAIQHFLDLRPSFDPPTTAVVRLAELVLKLTGFAFNGQFYKQICGVAMGTKMGPSFANLFVGLSEKKFFSSYAGVNPLYYGRFIDDGICAADCSRSELDIFIRSLGGLHPSLELKFVVSDTKVDFLDISISISENKIVTSVFNKPTNAHSYLRYDSSHPIHIKKSVPYSQFLRLRRICSDDFDYDVRCDELARNFLCRGYPNDVISVARMKASLFPQPVRMSKINQARTLPAVFTFHPSISKVTSVLQKNFVTLQNEVDTKHLFADTELLFAYRRCNSLRDQLVQSNLEDPEKLEPFGTFPCNRPRCKCCAHTSIDTSICAPKCTYNIRGRFSCISCNILYCISCRKCPGLHYIGETQQKLSERLNQHRSDINLNKPTTGVCKHFSLPNHSVSDIVLRVVRFTNCPTSKRRLQENTLIFKLGTETPNGLNDVFHF